MKRRPKLQPVEDARPLWACEHGKALWVNCIQCMQDIDRQDIQGRGKVITITLQLMGAAELVIIESAMLQIEKLRTGVLEEQARPRDATLDRVVDADAEAYFKERCAEFAQKRGSAALKLALGKYGARTLDGLDLRHRAALVADLAAPVVPATQAAA